MVTGVETAGLVLAVLPLVIEAAKSYKKGLDTIRDVASNSRRDEKLQEFYDKFGWEAYFLHRHLRDLIDELPLLCIDCKETLKANVDLTAWEEDPGVKDALLSQFGTQEDLDMFLLIMSRVLELFNRLIGEKTTHLSGADKDYKRMYLKLKRFASYRKAGVTSSSIQERVRFFKDEKNRDVCIKNLGTWNKRLALLSRSDRQKRQEVVSVAKPSSSFTDIKELFDSLVRALENHWHCTCSSQHEIMLCLRLWPSSIRHGNPVELEFEILLPGKSRQSSGLRWLESTILVQSKRKCSLSDRFLLPRLCDVLVDEGENSLRFLVEVNNSQETLWQLRAQPRKFPFLHDMPPRSLRQALFYRELLKLKDKRILALSFAYGLIQCHGSPCIKESLHKESIYFYHLAENNIDFERPFLSTQFTKLTQGSTPPNSALQHRNSAILSLGILLLEIHTGRLLESFFTPGEIVKQTPNTELQVARRMVENLEEWCTETYKNAVRACLEVPWVPTGEKVDLGDSNTSNGFYEYVVQRLEEELAHLLGKMF